MRLGALCEHPQHKSEVTCKQAILPATLDWCGKLVKIGSLLIKWAVAIPVWVRRETDVLSAGPL